MDTSVQHKQQSGERTGEEPVMTAERWQERHYNSPVCSEQVHTWGHELPSNERDRRSNRICRTWRVRGDLIETFKILTARERVKKEDFFQLRQREYNLRGHQYSLEVQRSRINIRSHFFSQQTVKHWNALPDHVVSASSVNNFKNRLDSCAEWGNWKRKLLQPDTIKRQVSKLSIQYGSNVADMWQLRVEYNSQITQL